MLTVLAGIVAVALTAYLAAVWLIVAALGVAVAAALWIHRLATGTADRPTPSVVALSESGARFAKLDAMGEPDELVHRLSDSQRQRLGASSRTELPHHREAAGELGSIATNEAGDSERPTRELPKADSDDDVPARASTSQITRLPTGHVPAAITRSRSVHTQSSVIR